MLCSRNTCNEWFTSKQRVPAIGSSYQLNIVEPLTEVAEMLTDSPGQTVAGVGVPTGTSGLGKTVTNTGVRTLKHPPAVSLSTKNVVVAVTEVANGFPVCNKVHSCDGVIPVENG